MHERRVAGHDHDEPLAVVLHALEQRLDGLRPEVHPCFLAGQGVRLVDEEDAVQRAANDPVGLDRGRADELAHEARAIDLDEVALSQEPHGAVHLREQPRDGRLAGAGVAEEDEVLAGRGLPQPVLLPAALNLEERDERVHLLLDGLEADEPVQLGLELAEAPFAVGSRFLARREALQLLRDPLALRAAVSRSRSPSWRRARPASSRGFRGIRRLVPARGGAETGCAGS